MQYLNLLVNYVLLFCSRKIDNKKISKTLVIASFILIWAFSTFREYILPYNMIGTDYMQYVNWFETISFTSKLQYKNLGFNLLILFVKLFTENHIVLFGVTSFIILYGIYKFVFSNSNYPELSMYIFITLSMLSVSFNVMRQWLACSIVWLAYEYIKEKSFFKYCIIIFLASLFHVSALVMIPVYFFVNGKAGIWKKFLICLIVVVVLSSPLANGLIKLFSVFGENYYIKYENSWQSASNYIMFFIALVNLAIMLFLRKGKITINNEIIESSLLLLLVIFSFLAPINIFFSRILIYFEPILLITIPYMLNFVKQSSKIYLYVALVMIFMVAYIN